MSFSEEKRREARDMRYHQKAYKSILSPQNGMNLYRGCTHGCIYCDSRSRCYQMLHDFEDIEVKTDAPVLLEAELRRKRRPCMIATGAMSDPLSAARSRAPVDPPLPGDHRPLWVRPLGPDEIQSHPAGSGTAGRYPSQNQMRGTDDPDHVRRIALPCSGTRRLYDQSAF